MRFSMGLVSSSRRPSSRKWRRPSQAPRVYRMCSASLEPLEMRESCFWSHGFMAATMGAESWRRAVRRASGAKPRTAFSTA
jgi:hypothetical protein